MKQKIIILILLISVMLIGKVDSAILTQKLGSEYIETTVEEYEAVTMTFVSKKGFRFRNWLLIEGNIEINTTSEEINFEMPNENVTIEAEYDTEYIITFNSNDGTGTTTSMSIVSGDTENLISNPFTRDGYRFIGWSKETNGTVLYQDEADCTPEEDLILYAIWEINEVTVEFNSNGGSTVSSKTVIYGGTYGELPEPTKSGYTFKGWYKEESLENEVTSETEVAISVTHTLYAKWKAPWNEPVLGSGMKAVNWDGSSWTVLDNKADWEYNYTMATAGTTTVAGDGTAKWANAVIDADNDGTYESQYVWIPRFTYKVTNGNNYSWNADENSGTAKTQIIFSDGSIDDTSSGTYSKHSAFTLKDASGNITKELDGFWISKFVASKGSENRPLSKPNATSWNNENISNMFEYSKELNITLGTHMLKSCEYGAVVYLTSALGRIPYPNNTRYINNCFTTGYANTEQSGDGSLVTNYASTGGIKASSTHNVYGVYDLSNSGYVLTAGYCQGSTDTSIASLEDSYNTDGTKYVDILPSGSDSAFLSWDGTTGSYGSLANTPIPGRGNGVTSMSMFGNVNCHGSEDTSKYFRVSLWGNNP